jgi:hypothetical protein
MAPAFLKELRRRSRASFRTDNSTDGSSDGAASQGTSPSSGSVTPPSLAHQSDPALDLQIKKTNTSQQGQAQPTQPPRSMTSPPVNNSSRQSVSGMSGLGSPPVNGRNTVPLSQYAPRICNISENSWVRILNWHHIQPAPYLCAPYGFIHEYISQACCTTSNIHASKPTSY